MKTSNKQKLDSFVKVNSIMIVGRRWFEKTNGNTYHSSEIYVNNDLIHKIDFTYGYGDMYVHSAWEWLKSNNYIKVKESDSHHPRLWCEENNVKWNYTVADVKRKKDL